jgi:hypothetical protein
MKNIKYLYALAFVALLFFGSACTEDFEEMNTNPNLPVSVPLANHLAGTIVSFDGGNMVISDGMITISTRYVGGRWGLPIILLISLPSRVLQAQVGRVIIPT